MHVSSYRTCFVCRLNFGTGSQTVSSEDRYLVLLKKNIFVPEGARCCSDHNVNRRLTSDAIDQIAPLSVQYKEFDSKDVHLMISTWQMLFQKQKRFDFDDERLITDDEYKSLTSLSKEQFNDMIDQISGSNIRHSSNRSIRTALAILLCKLRLGLSNHVLSILFQLPNKRTVARSIETTRKALMNGFVSNNVGFAHISRNDIIRQHTSSIAQRLEGDDDADTTAVVVDGTYLYIQVS